MHESDILIIGAGISGLICATELQQAGLDVRLVDKGRGVGGRMSTRRMSGSHIDHGAQFFTVRDKRFHAYVQQWLDRGIVREWYRNIPSDTPEEPHIRYCGVSGMSDAPKYLARGCNVHCGERMQNLSREHQHWIAAADSGETYRARELVITAPLPQTLQLLDTSGLDYAGDARNSLRNITYAKGLALLAVLDGPSGLPAPGAIKLQNDTLSWVADNQMKGISPIAAITVHAKATFAEKHWDSEDAIRAPLMIEAIQPELQSNIVAYQCHRWGFTHPLNPWQQNYYRNPECNLTLAGDGFGGPRVEAAAISGIEAAQQILR